MDIESLMDTGIGSGCYQIGVLITTFLFSFISTDSFAINFIAGKMVHTCSQISQLDSEKEKRGSLSQFLNGTYGMNECGIIRSADVSNESDPIQSVHGLTCTRWKYDRSEYVSTIVSEYDLVCQRAWLIDMVSTCYMAGRLFSCLTHGYFSDKFGRKKVLIGSHVLKLAGGVMSLYAPIYPVFAFSRFVIAVGSTASCMASFVLLVECAGSRWRNRFGILFNCSVAFGGMFLPLVAYLVRDFKHLQMIYTWPQFLIFFCYFILDESPRWLTSQGREDDALKVMRRMASVNNQLKVFEKSLNKMKTNSLQLVNAKTKPNGSSFAKKCFCAEMFESKILATKTFILWLCWFVSALMYYAISLNTGRLPGSVYLNTFFLTMVEIPANLLSIYVLEKFGGRITLAVFTISAAVASFLMIPFMFCIECEFVVTAFGILGKGLITVSYNVLYVETADTYPTKIRSQALGVSASFGRFSSMASSFLGGVMADVWQPLPSLIFGSLALISGSLFTCFPKDRTGDMVTCNREVEKEKKPMVNGVENEEQSLA